MTTPRSALGGWRHDPAEVQRTLATMPHPLFAAAASHLKGSGANKTVLLYQAYKDVNQGQYLDYPGQQIGDCVSHAFGHGIDLLAAVQIVLNQSGERFEQTATEPIYAMARVDVGGLKNESADGAVGAWAAKAVSTIGTIRRALVGPYDGDRAKRWGRRGVPADLAPEAADHKVRAVSLVSTYHALEDALANGYPVTVCSSQGFTEERDRQGFCAPSGRWNHAMLIVGVRADQRPGACIFQSWGPDQPAGPRTLDQPSNSFWADRDVVETMLKAGDSWAVSHFDGYPAQDLPTRWSYAGFA